MKLPAFVHKAARAPIAALRRIHRALVEVWLVPVRLYRRFLSPLKLTGSCRFQPTCSRYAMDAVREWGILCGTLLAVFRVIRCNPFSEGGYDPVPTRKDTKEKIRRLFRKDPIPPASPDEPETGNAPDNHQSPMEH